MPARNRRTTTAMLAAFSLLQPLPAMSQATPEGAAEEAGAQEGWEKLIDGVPLRSFEELCAEAGIEGPEACETHVLALKPEAEAGDAPAAAEAVDGAEAPAEEVIEGAEGEAAGDGAADAAAPAEAGAGAADAPASPAEPPAEEAIDQGAPPEAEAGEAQDAEGAAAGAAEAETAPMTGTEAEAGAEAAVETETAPAGAEVPTADDAAAAAEADAPVEAEATDAPVEAEADAAPVEAEEADAPVEAEAADAPVEAEAADAPVEAEATDAPVESEAADAPAPAATADAPGDDAATTQAAGGAAGSAPDAEVPADPATVAETAEPTEVPAADVAGTDAAGATACLAATVAADGTTVCIDEVSPGSIAASAAEAGDSAAPDVEVTTQTVTEADVRSSSEDFEAAPQGQEVGTERAAAASEASASDRSDGGLTDLEKAGLLVLGTVIVGAILNNGQRVEANTGDRVVVVDDDGTYRVLKDDDALLREPGAEVRTERFGDGSTRTTVTRDDGTRIITVRDTDGRALRRLRIDPDGREYLLIDDTHAYDPVIVEELPKPDYEDLYLRAASDRESLRQALRAAERRDLGRSFSLRQVRDYVEVRALAPEINFASITFATNSAALDPTQARQLREMGLLMRDFIADDPSELFLVEGHTDAVGAAGYNLLLSDRRAESVALALGEYFGVPAENMVVQGYGEGHLKVPTLAAERANRRVAVRRITPLMERY